MPPKLYAFDHGCPKCRAAPGLRMFCDGCKQIKQGEHLHCDCGECGFWWVSRCADDVTTGPTKKDEPGGK